MPVLVNRISGLGDARTTGFVDVAAGAATGLLTPGGDKAKQLIMSAPAIAGGVLTAGGSSSIAATAWGTLAIPIVGAAVAGVTIGLMLLLSRKGPKQKEATTQIVDQIEPQLQANLRGYLEGPRTAESQEQALANFDGAWQWIMENCGAAEMGEPGRRCISERQRGGSAPWCPTGRGCDWFILYRDPIANDMPVRASSSGSGAADSIASIFGGSSSPGGASSMLPLLLGGGLIAAALLL